MDENEFKKLSQEMQNKDIQEFRDAEDDAHLMNKAHRIAAGIGRELDVSVTVSRDDGYIEFHAGEHVGQIRETVLNLKGFTEEGFIRSFVRSVHDAVFPRKHIDYVSDLADILSKDTPPSDDVANALIRQIRKP